MQALLSQFARNSKKSKTLEEAVNTTVDVIDDEGDDEGDDESDTESSAGQQDDEELDDREVLVIEDDALAEAEAVEDDEVEEAVQKVAAQVYVSPSAQKMARTALTRVSYVFKVVFTNSLCGMARSLRSHFG
jgi:hypothetical protein